MAVDVTWNDPVVIGEGELTESQKSKYLLKGKSFLDNHKEDGMISENSMKFISRRSLRRFSPALLRRVRATISSPRVSMRVNFMRCHRLPSSSNNC